MKAVGVGVSAELGWSKIVLNANNNDCPAILTTKEETPCDVPDDET